MISAKYLMKAANWLKGDGIFESKESVGLL